MSLKDIFASVAGQENADLSETTIIATAEEAAEAIVDKEIAEAEADIAEHDKDIASHETAIEALEEKVEELEEEVGGMESMLSGATPFNAELFAHRFARAAKISAKFGQPVEVQGAESYADASTASLNAYAGVESFKETAGKAVGAIKKFFVDLYNSFIAMFVGLFNKLKGLKAKAGNLKAAVNAGTVKDGEISLPKSSALLEANGSSKAISALIAVQGKAFSELGGLGLAREGDSAQAAHAVADAFGAAGSKTIEGKTDDTEKLVVKVGSNATVEIVAPVRDGGLGKASVSVKLGEAGKGGKLDKSVLLSLVNSVASDADKLHNAKLDKNALTTQRDKAIGAIEKNQAPKADRSDDDKKEVKSTVGAVKGAHTAALKYARAATNLGADILEAQLAFVKAHLGGSAPKAEGAK
jgi:cytochrome c556